MSRTCRAKPPHPTVTAVRGRRPTCQQMIHCKLRGTCTYMMCAHVRDIGRVGRRDQRDKPVGVLYTMSMSNVHASVHMSPHSRTPHAHLYFHAQLFYGTTACFEGTSSSPVRVAPLAVTPMRTMLAATHAHLFPASAGAPMSGALVRRRSDAWRRAPREVQRRWILVRAARSRSRPSPPSHTKHARCGEPQCMPHVTCHWG